MDTTHHDGSSAPSFGAAWRLGPRFVMRLGGLPLSAVHALRCSEARRDADLLIQDEAALRAAGAELADRLGALVGSLHPDERRAVLALRRHVFNNRLPGDRPAAEALAARLGKPVGEELAAWLAARAGHDEARTRLAEELAAQLRRSRGELRRLAGEERLRRGLLLASPTLEGRLDDYAAGLRPESDKRTRKQERALLHYLHRTACKTSPFSTFTSVAAGAFLPGPSGAVVFDDEQRSHPRLNVAVLARLAQVAAADRARRDDLPVAPAAGLALAETRVRYVRRSLTTGDDSRSVAFDTAEDRVYFLRRSGVLDRLLGFLADRPDARCGELLQKLREDTSATEEEAEHYLAALLDLGLLQLPALATDVHDRNPLAAFRERLRALDRPWAADTADRLGAVADRIERYRDAGAAERRKLLTALRRDLLAVQTELGAADASVPQVLLYEDAAVGAVAADRDTWDRLAEPLAQLAPLLAAYDPQLAGRLTFKGFFVARFGSGGRCEDLLTLVHDFHEDIYDRYLDFAARPGRAAPDGGRPPEENWLRQPEITAINRARAELTAQLRALWSDHSDHQGGSAELFLSPQAVSAAAAHLGALPRAFQPQSHFVQWVRRTDDPLLVLNNAYGGLGYPFTRFTHCLREENGDEVGEALRAQLREHHPDGAVFAEVTAGAATTNLNLHDRLTDYEIVCPGETSTADPDARLDLDDLYVVHDEKDDRLVLRSRRLEREVVPLYLGYLVSVALPEIPRTLLLLSPAFQAQPDPWRGVPEGPAVEGVTTRPRLRYGALVLQRRSWTATTDVLPRREPGGDETPWYLAWLRWRARHGLPDQVFARIRPDAASGGGPDDKPQYVDFDSPLSLLALDAALAERPGRVVFEEMLPSGDELAARSAAAGHVSELVVELLPAIAASQASRSTEAAQATEEGPR
ncbi:lantibiotic dehydratase [Streptacidiphilus melanogenes]|uniref:lantibiotic dehydratase n=1 Tax=Streptacidiphilus melanogenes TaxID=411235 RepID=UPI0007C752C3|nr:lantibiotic dehydratase [Streptacidiphilus melanogenes]